MPPALLPPAGGLGCDSLRSLWLLRPGQLSALLDALGTQVVGRPLLPLADVLEATPGGGDRLLAVLHASPMLYLQVCS
jgi:hypothetical protein